MYHGGNSIDFLNDLANRKGVVLMYGPGFSAPDGMVRISLANLNTEDYREMARRLFELLDEYCADAGSSLENAA
jgi:aspartate 4-decarboxylase